MTENEYRDAPKDALIEDGGTDGLIICDHAGRCKIAPKFCMHVKPHEKNIDCKEPSCFWLGALLPSVVCLDI